MLLDQSKKRALIPLLGLSLLCHLFVKRKCFNFFFLIFFYYFPLLKQKVWSFLKLNNNNRNSLSLCKAKKTLKRNDPVPSLVHTYLVKGLSSPWRLPDLTAVMRNLFAAFQSRHFPGCPILTHLTFLAWQPRRIKPLGST